MQRVFTFVTAFVIAFLAPSLVVKAELVAKANHAFLYQSYPAGARLHWVYEPADGAEQQPVTYRVLASGDRFMIQTSLAPFEILRDDYALFVEYRGVGVVDCRAAGDEAELTAILDEVDALWPLTPGKKSGRFESGLSTSNALFGAAAQAGTPLLAVQEKADDGDTIVTWSGDLKLIVQIDWPNGGGRSRLLGVENTDAKQANIIPRLCQDTLPDWFWRRIGAV